MGKKSQKQKVAEILKAQGYIDNFCAVETKLSLRLGAIIHELIKDGWQFDEKESGYLEGTKNWRYVLKSRPQQRKYSYIVSDGVAKEIVEYV